MKKFLAFSLWILLAWSVVQAQPSIDQFSTLESQGPMPADFQKILKTDKEMTDYNVFLRELIMEGKILYGTKLNDYVNTVIDNLLKDDAVLRSKIHAYIVKSPEVNACATKNGLVLVNLGLLAQVSNESELAFVLAHEISHFAEKHADSPTGKKDTLRERDMLKYYVKYQNRSREQETAADRIALTRFFANSGYSYQAMMSVFDVLQYSDLPFDEVPFPKDMVETSFYQFPSNYYLANVAPISNRDNMVDTLFTHPNIAKRRMAANAIIAGKSDDGRSAFLQPEELFNEVRELARFECLNYYLTEHQYDQAFYNAYVLRRAHPNNAFIEQTIVAALYGYSKHRNYGQSNEALQSYKKVEGEMQQTSYFLSKLSRPESSLLALRTAWKAKEKHPDDTYYADVVKDLLKDICIKNKMKFNDFSDFPMGTNPDSIVVEENNVPQDSAINKYSRIKQQNQNNKVVPTSKFKTVNFMLVDIHQNPEFVNLMNLVVAEAEDEQILNIVTEKKAANVSSIIIADPQYVVYGRNGINAKASERCAKKLVKNMSAGVRRLHLTPVYYQPKDVCAFTTEQYNGYAKFQQRMHEYEQSGGTTMVYPKVSNMDAAFDLAGTTKVCVMAVKRSPGRFVSIHKTDIWALTAICPYILPATIASFALPRYSTDMYFLINDFETGETLTSGHDSQVSAMSESYVNSFMYEKLYRFVKGK
ncbi:MAG: M48 family metalloprotease [Bacteroidales bacterium]|nr:M48 family metalloprotease [Bacteroidales bacterium]